MAIEEEFQALTLAEAQEEIQAYEAQSHRSIWGRGHPKTMKPSPRFIQAPMGLDYSPNKFQERRGKNQRSHHHDSSHYAPRKVTLDQNKLASSRQLPRMQRQNVSWRQAADQSGYYSYDSELNSVCVTLVSASESSTNKR